MVSDFSCANLSQVLRDQGSAGAGPFDSGMYPEYGFGDARARAPGINMQLDDAAEILRKADFFDICSPEQLRMLGFASDMRVVLSGDSLFRQGDVVDGAYVLISGELVSKSSEEDEGVPIDESGTVLAELALIAEHPRRTTVKAKTDVEILFVPRSAFMKLIQQFPGLGSQMQVRIKENLRAFINPIADIRKRIS